MVASAYPIGHDVGPSFIRRYYRDVVVWPLTKTFAQLTQPRALRAVLQKTFTHSLKESFPSKIEKLHTAGFPEMEILRACHKLIKCTVVGELVRVSEQYVSRCVWEITQVICLRLFPEYVQLPDAADANAVMARFYAVGQFAGVTGCIDCTHAPTGSPGGENAEVFRNRKGSISFIVQREQTGCQHEASQPAVGASTALDDLPTPQGVECPAHERPKRWSEAALVQSMFIIIVLPAVDALLRWNVMPLVHSIRRWQDSPPESCLEWPPVTSWVLAGRTQGILEFDVSQPELTSNSCANSLFLISNSGVFSCREAILL
ncbi:hypothetical protein HPB50_027953 [Hyalomma asiaticum]|nr:hypothetical protein HPB50_027953 [Hyalomma asiaticum]